MNKEFIAWMENSPKIKGDALVFAEAAFVAGMLASLKQQPDAGALVSALEDIADNDDEEARNLGLLADIIFTAKQALKKYRGEK